MGGRIKQTQFFACSVWQGKIMKEHRNLCNHEGIGKSYLLLSLSTKSKRCQIESESTKGDTPIIKLRYFVLKDAVDSIKQA